MKPRTLASTTFCAGWSAHGTESRAWTRSSVTASPVSLLSCSAGSTPSGRHDSGTAGAAQLSALWCSVGGWGVTSYFEELEMVEFEEGGVGAETAVEAVEVLFDACIALSLSEVAVT